MSHLIHAYASKYYDPVKAHEYYMKNRELKGRSISELSKEDKAIWRIAKSNIQADKKAALNEARTTHNTKIRADLYKARTSK